MAEQHEPNFAAMLAAVQSRGWNLYKTGMADTLDTIVHPGPIELIEPENTYVVLPKISDPRNAGQMARACAYMSQVRVIPFLEHPNGIIPMACLQFHKSMVVIQSDGDYRLSYPEFASLLGSLSTAPSPFAFMAHLN